MNIHRRQKGVLSAISVKEQFEIALLNLLQDERIEVLIDGNVLTGRDALKLRTKDMMKRGKFRYRDDIGRGN